MTRDEQLRLGMEADLDVLGYLEIGAGSMPMTLEHRRVRAMYDDEIEMDADLAEWLFGFATRYAHIIDGSPRARAGAA